MKMIEDKFDLFVFILIALFAVYLGISNEAISKENHELKIQNAVLIEENKNVIQSNEKIENINTGLYNEIDRLKAVSMEAWQLFYYCITDK